MRLLLPLLLTLILCGCASDAAPVDATPTADAVRTVSTQDATASWNQFCTIFNFNQTPTPFSYGTIFNSATLYNGSNFAYDFGKLLQVIAADLQTATPNWDGSEYARTSLENW